MVSTFTVKIDTANAAFQPDPGLEIIRILANISLAIAAGEPYDTFKTILDTDGNDVGRWALKPSDEQAV